MKFQKKLIVGYLLVAVIPLLIVSSAIYYGSAKSMEDSAQEFASLYTAQIKTSLNQFVLEYENLTKLVLVDSDIFYPLDSPKQLTMDEFIIKKMNIQRLLMRITVLKPEITNLILIDRNNQMYQYSTTTSIVNDKLLMAQEWFNNYNNKEETFFITGLHDRGYYEDNLDGTAVTVGRVLFGSDGAYAGVILFDLDPYTLLQLDHDFVLAREKYGITVNLYNRHGDIIYNSDAASGRVNWKEILEAGDEYGAKENDDEELLILTGETDSNFLLIKTSIPRNKLMIKIDRIKIFTVIVIVSSCLIMTLLTIVLSYSITKPIKALRRSMKQAELGQYVPIDKEPANDEIGSLIFSYNKMILTIRTLINDVYIAEIRHRKAKYTALQNQINPHMLYNTLESIRMKALVKEQDEIASMIKILARMFRLSLGKEGKQLSVKHEVEYTQNYLKILNIRFDNKFLFDIRIPDEIMQCNIIPLVFQPIVENSVNHGFIDTKQAMSIVITGSYVEHKGIMFRITDDGAGIAPDKLAELRFILENIDLDKIKFEEADDHSERGLGLKNIAERIKLHYGNQYYLTVYSEVGRGTTVELLVPEN